VTGDGCDTSPLPGVRWFTPPHPYALSVDECEVVPFLVGAREPGGYSTYVASAEGPPRARLAGVVAGTVADRTWADERLAWASAQMLTYRTGDSFRWHTDRNPVHGWDAIVFSTIAQLSDPGDYEGGGVEFRENGRVVTLPRTMGTVAVFRATVRHRVLPITAGTRLSLTSFHRDREQHWRPSRPNETVGQRRIDDALDRLLTGLLPPTSR
jgi:hypothetical protein